MCGKKEPPRRTQVAAIPEARHVELAVRMLVTGLYLFPVVEIHIFQRLECDGNALFAILSTTWRMMSNGNVSEARQLYIPSCIFCRPADIAASFPGTFKEIEAEMSSGAAFVAPAPVMPTKSITPKQSFSLIVTSVFIVVRKISFQT